MGYTEKDFYFITYPSGDSIEILTEDIRRWQEVAYAKQGGAGTPFNPSTSGLVRLCLNTPKLISPDNILGIAVYNKSGNHGLRIICPNSDLSLTKEDASLICESLVKEDMKDGSYVHFAEASGPIEWFFTKNKAYVVPNFFVHRIVGCSANKITLDIDLVHYDRDFGKTVHRKVMFGFPTQKLFAKCVQECEKEFKGNLIIANYDSFLSYAWNVLEEEHKRFKEASQRTVKMSRKRNFKNFLGQLVPEAQNEYDYYDDSEIISMIAEICIQYFSAVDRWYNEEECYELPESVLSYLQEFMKLYAALPLPDQTDQKDQLDVMRYYLNVIQPMQLKTVRKI